MNTAGKIDPAYTPEAAAEAAIASSSTGPPALVADLISRGLFTYLERSIAKYSPFAPALFCLASELR